MAKDLIKTLNSVVKKVAVIAAELAEVNTIYSSGIETNKKEAQDLFEKAENLLELQKDLEKKHEYLKKQYAGVNVIEKAAETEKYLSEQNSLLENKKAKFEEYKNAETLKLRQLLSEANDKESRNSAIAASLGRESAALQEEKQKYKEKVLDKLKNLKA